jgi:hypothetical protein
MVIFHFQATSSVHGKQLEKIMLMCWWWSLHFPVSSVLALVFIVVAILRKFITRKGLGWRIGIEVKLIKTSLPSLFFLSDDSVYDETFFWSK